MGNNYNEKMTEKHFNWRYNMKYLWIFFILISCLCISSCFSIPCKINAEINNSSKEPVEIEIYNINNNLYYKIEAFEQLKIKNNDLKYTDGNLLIKTSNQLKYFSFGEYDHWFPTTHKIIIDITGNEIKVNMGGLNSYEEANSYEDYEV
jgi:hypothetical protein